MERDVEINTAPARLSAILVNLLDNAAKYGGDHLVELRAAVEGSTLVVEVSDRGPGLGGRPAEELFEAFVRGDVGQTPGKGVGLYVVRKLARSMAGDVTLKDRPGGGLVARLVLPQRRQADAEGPLSAMDALAQLGG